MSSLPKNLMRRLNTENIILEPRRQSPNKKGKQLVRDESPSRGESLTPSPSKHTLFETPLPRVHYNLPSNIPMPVFQHENALDNEKISDIIQSQMAAALKNFSIANNANLQEQQQQYQQQLQQIQQQQQEQLQQQHQQLILLVQQQQQPPLHPPPPPQQQTSPMQTDIPFFNPCQDIGYGVG